MARSSVTARDEDRPLGPPPHRPRPPRQLLGRGEELGRPAGAVRVPLLRRRPPRAHDRLRRHLGGPGGDARGRDRLALRRPRPREVRHLRPVARAADRRARAHLRDDHAARLARARADLQGADRAAPREGPRDLRLPRLPGADDGRHRALPRALRARSGRTRRATSRSAARSSGASTASTATSSRSRRRSSPRRRRCPAWTAGRCRRATATRSRSRIGASRGREEGHVDGDGPGPRAAQRPRGTPTSATCSRSTQLYSPPEEVEVVDASAGRRPAAASTARST